MSENRIGLTSLKFDLLVLRGLMHQVEQDIKSDNELVAQAAIKERQAIKRRMCMIDIYLNTNAPLY